jgi:predicted RNA-binding protein YlqC (UPF0109 family)
VPEETDRRKLRELLTRIIKALIEDEASASVVETHKDACIVLTLRVAKADRGKLIGRQGRTARSIRTIVAAIASKTKQRYSIEIFEE